MCVLHLVCTIWARRRDFIYNRAPTRYVLPALRQSHDHQAVNQASRDRVVLLELIRDFGLLLTPEIARWEYPHADGTPPRSASMIQRRVSFTELSPAELARHSDEFGHFALEFEIDTLKSLGAMPVFYVPRAVDGADSLADTIVMQIIDAMRLTDRIARVVPILGQASPEQTVIPISFGMSDSQKVYMFNPAQARETLAGISYPGTTTFLNQEFRRHLGSVPFGTCVHNLIVLTVSDLENLDTSIENFGFAEFFKNYSAQIPNRNVSVHNFLALSPRYSELARPSKKLMSTTDVVLEALKRELFPPKD